MEGQTARNKQAEAWGQALLASAQNKGGVLRSSSEWTGRQFYAHRLNEPFVKFGTVLTVESNVEIVAVNLDSDSHSD